MRPPGYLLVVWTLAVWRSSGTEGGTTREDVINAARCRVRCLSEISSSLELPVPTKVQPPVSFADCLASPECTACLKPCTQPFVSQQLCQRVCESDTEECTRSCRFLKQITTIRPGTCPPDDDSVEGFEPAGPCIAACTDDKDCPNENKCCANGCGKTCQQPYNVHSGMPTLPTAPEIRERPKGGSLKLKWTSVSSNTSGPILYIVDAKYNVGKYHSESLMTPWQQISQTTMDTAVIRDITPGHWYQFRVASVNIYGSKGASLPTEPFKLTREPRPPNPPSNLTEGDTLILGGKVAVSIHWLPPIKSDLPVTRYKVFWSKRLKRVTPDMGMTLKEHRQVLPGGQLEFQLPELEPDTTYFVQVQAISRYGDVKLKSEKSSVYITTYPLPRSAERVVATPSVVIRPLPTPAAIHVLEVDNPFYQNGLLKANISWSLPDDPDSPEIEKYFVYWAPEVCIAADKLDDGLAKVMSASTHELFFVIYDLRFDCRYLVRIQPVTKMAVTGPETHMSFPTPPCTDVTVLGDMGPNCPTNVPRVPDEPSNLQHTILIKSHNITAKLSWEPPLSSTPVMSYRVVWGPALMDGEAPTMDRTSAITKVLTKDEHSFSIGNLQEASTYVVTLQALSHVGPGRLRTFFFTTPIMQSHRATPINPPYIAITPPVELEDNEINIHVVTKGPTPQPMGRPSQSSPSHAHNIKSSLNCIFIITLLSFCLNYGIDL